MRLDLGQQEIQCLNLFLSPNSLEEEVVCITWRRRQHDNDRHQPMLKQAGRRGIQRPVAGEEFGEGKHAFTAQLLHNSSLGEQHGQDVAKGRQGHKDGHGTLGTLAHDVAEERRGDDLSGVDDLLLGDGRKVGNVDENVEDPDGDDCQRSSDLEGPGRIAGFTQRLDKQNKNKRSAHVFLDSSKLAREIYISRSWRSSIR